MYTQMGNVIKCMKLAAKAFLGKIQNSSGSGLILYPSSLRLHRSRLMRTKFLLQAVQSRERAPYGFSFLHQPITIFKWNSNGLAGDQGEISFQTPILNYFGLKCFMDIISS
jgi:hypothetical protein